jgi:murein L,D-transpeptidase YafK
MSHLVKALAVLCVLLCATFSAKAENPVEAPMATPAGPAGEDDQPSELEKQLAQEGFRLGAPTFIRIFKADSSLEVWMLRQGRFDL